MMICQCRIGIPCRGHRSLGQATKMLFKPWLCKPIMRLSADEKANLRLFRYLERDRQASRPQELGITGLRIQPSLCRVEHPTWKMNKYTNTLQIYLRYQPCSLLLICRKNVSVRDVNSSVVCYANFQGAILVQFRHSGGRLDVAFNFCFQ